MIAYRKVLEVRAFTPTERRLYDIWQAIRGRCKNPNATFYRHYGGRGISICKEWDECFVKFANDVGLPPTDMDLDRKDNDGNYEPGNVRWVTHADNVKNTRRKRLITIDGVTKNMSEWCDEYKIGRPTMFRRLALGWTGRDLLKKAEMAGWGEKIIINGQSKTADEWAEIVGISSVGFRARLAVRHMYTDEELIRPNAKWKSSRHYKEISKSPIDMPATPSP